jgi:hypothetical protein
MLTTQHPIGCIAEIEGDRNEHIIIVYIPIHYGINLHSKGGGIFRLVEFLLAVSNSICSRTHGF